ncbi:aminoglycoside phosphotransferase [Camelimonas fluminis]|uniref:Phosphotransferase family protein n=1 Tax=Camelimonas fluminis TaxID=1576911 RepID=A0ABV7UG73_9HYPH|nr:phosphotransferase family protein [Camelimonas fluminis]GHE78441.1 aminoglycoside phosphotransferase [Camelimonas fluminis]
MNEQGQELAGRLQVAARRMLDDGRLNVRDLSVMEDGHAGLTYGFELVDGEGGQRGEYILKMAPAGVTRRGNTDVYRQAPLLKALKGEGLLTPDVPWASASEEMLGAPFIVMDKLPGRVFVVWEPHPSFLGDPALLRSVWWQAARLLAAVHRIDWREALPHWETPRLLLDELDRWSSLRRHAEGTEWLAPSAQLDTELRASMPDPAPVGLVHGDFQPGNILFDNGVATGIIDWELASIGAQGLDVGWLMMMSDSRAWHADWQPVAPVPPHDLLAEYKKAGGPAVRHLAWHQAFAQYRLGSIACLNVKLHRSGKRRDDLWERFAPSISSLFSHGSALLAGAAEGHRRD